MENDKVLDVETSIEKRQEQDIEVLLSPVMDLVTAKARLATFQEFVKDYLVETRYDEGKEVDGDYGVIPGTKKPTLFKPGADKLCELYGLSDEYEIVSEYSREDWSAHPPLFDYTIRCILRNKRNERLVSTGLGSCNSYEGRYRWRDSYRKCPSCGKETIFKSKKEGEGWFCWAKKGGCGSTFAEAEVRIIGQQTGKVENEDIATLKNTILKMSKKRAKIDATLSATRSSGIFTQDMEDVAQPPETANQPQPQSSPAKTSAPAVPKAVAPTLPEGETIVTLTNLVAKVDMSKRKFFSFQSGGKTIRTWDDKLFPFLSANENKQVLAVLDTKGNFTTLISARPIKEDSNA